MSNDLVVNSSNDDDGEYYSSLLRRTVRKPTPVLYIMIKEIRKYEKIKKVMEEQICER